MFNSVPNEEVYRKLVHGFVIVLPLGVFYGPNIFAVERSFFYSFHWECYCTPYSLSLFDFVTLHLVVGLWQLLDRCFGRRKKNK